MFVAVRVQQFVLNLSRLAVSRLSLTVLQVSSRDWGPVLGTDIDRIDSAKKISVIFLLPTLI